MPDPIADIKAWAEKIANSPLVAGCEHAVHPNTTSTDGWYPCGICGMNLPIESGVINWEGYLVRDKIESLRNA